MYVEDAVFAALHMGSAGDVGDGKGFFRNRIVSLGRGFRSPNHEFHLYLRFVNVA